MGWGDGVAVRIDRLMAVALLVSTAAFINDAAASVAPLEPSVILDTTAVPPTGKTIEVDAGGDLQGALNSAQPGDVVELAAGATFTGNFVLPAKSGADATHWVLIRSSAYASLPPAGSRVAPSNAASMAKVQTTNTAPALAFANGAKFYRLQGIEITTTWSARTATQYGLVTLGMGSDGSTNATALSDLPSDVVFDRCYVHGTATGNIRRGILINSARTAVIDSYISDIHEVGADTQAVGAWNGSGPFAIINNYLEAAGENVMFGGADPSISNLVASDIEIRNNLVSKPLSWKSGDPSYAGIEWSVKNLLELKNAQRLLIDGNVFERSWPAAQVGFAIVLTPRNQNGNAPWSTVQDVTFTNNIVRFAANGVNMLGQDTPGGGAGYSQRQTRVLIANNLFHHIDTILFQVLGGVNNLTIQHNTGLQGGNIISLDGTPPDQSLAFVDNITPHNAYGVFGSNVGVGNPALSTYAPGAVFTNNAIAGPWPSSGGATTAMYSNYPGNFFPDSLDAVSFVDRANDNYRLSANSPFKGKASDGTDVGVDFNALDAAQSGSNAPAPSTSTTPPAAPSPTVAPTPVTTDPPTPVSTAPPTPAPTTAPPPLNDTTAPSTSIIRPLSGATVSGTQPISVTASDTIAVTEGAILIDGTIVASFSGDAATYNWNTTRSAVGPHKLQSKVQDAAGNVGMSAPVPVTVSNTDTTPPSVTITYPTSGATVAPGTQTITENVSDNVGVTLVKTLINGTVICQKTAPPYSCPVWLSGTVATVDVIGYDAAGNSRMAEVNVKVASGGSTSLPSPADPTTPDTTPPSVTITYPTSGATVARGAQTITENVSDNVGVTLVKTLINGTVICQKTAPPYSCPVSLSGTLATVDVIAYDAAGNTRMAEVNVKVASGGSSSGPKDTTPPSVTITYPTSGTSMNRGTKTNITARASDNAGVAGVKTYVNGSLLCQRNSAPYSCPWTVANTNKVQIQVRALDSAGNTGVASVTVFPR